MFHDIAVDDQARIDATVLIQTRWREHKQRKNEYLLWQRDGQRSSSGAKTASHAVVTHDASPSRTVEQERVELLDTYQRLVSERGAIVEQNLMYQRVLAKHFAERRARQGGEEIQQLTTPESEAKYWGMVAQLGEKRKQLVTRHEAVEEALAEQRRCDQDILNEAALQEKEFEDYLQTLSESPSFMRSRTTASVDSVAAFLQRAAEQRQNIRQARTHLIQLRNRRKKLARATVSRDEQHDGMYLIDFEQLKIENTNLNDKLEERNDDIVKLRRKVTTTIHVLTHVKEKLQFMKGENAELQREVGATEEELSGVRDQLAQMKRRRDQFMKANMSMKEKMPLVGSHDLLKDYEKRKAEIDQKRGNVVGLPKVHRELNKWMTQQQTVIEALRVANSRYPGM